MFKLCYSSGGLSLYVCLYFLNKMTSLPEIYLVLSCLDIKLTDGKYCFSILANANEMDQTNTYTHIIQIHFISWKGQSVSGFQAVWTSAPSPPHARGKGWRLQTPASSTPLLWIHPSTTSLEDQPGSRISSGPLEVAACPSWPCCRGRTRSW